MSRNSVVSLEAKEINGWELLRNAVVLQAVKDYEDALKGKKVNSKDPQHVIEDLENYFKGPDYEGLTKISGRAVIRQCRENVINYYEDDNEAAEKRIKKNNKKIQKIKAMKEP